MSDRNALAPEILFIDLVKDVEGECERMATYWPFANSMILDPELQLAMILSRQL